MECAGAVDESSQQSSNLAWFSHMRSACDTTQRKFESRVSEGKLLSAILPSVSRIEVSDSPCQGRAVKVNSQVFDLMPSRPAESRSVPLSVKEATSLETTLRGVMESYNFQLWTITALFRFLCDSNRGAENIAAALTSSTAFVTAKRREAFLSNMFPSVRDAQKRKLLSDPIFDQKDLFAPASIEAAREAARDFSLYRGAQSRPTQVPHCQVGYLGSSIKALKTRYSQHAGISDRTGRDLAVKQQSSIREHSSDCHQDRIKLQDFKVLDSCSNVSDLRILESIFIHRLRPRLNQDQSSFPLSIIY